MQYGFGIIITNTIKFLAVPGLKLFDLIYICNDFAMMLIGFGSDIMQIVRYDEDVRGYNF